MDEQKAADMILFLLSKEPSNKLGKVKLMLMMYYADFDHYERYGTSISGATYYKREMGPWSYEIEQLLHRMVQPNERPLRAEDI